MILMMMTMGSRDISLVYTGPKRYHEAVRECLDYCKTVVCADL